MTNNGPCKHWIFILILFLGGCDNQWLNEDKIIRLNYTKEVEDVIPPDDYTDNCAEAEIINIDNEIHGNINRAEDVDFFIISISSKGTLYVNNTDNGKIVCSLLNQACDTAPMTPGDFGGQDVDSDSYYLSEPGNYYLKISKDELYYIAPFDYAVDISFDENKIPPSVPQNVSIKQLKSTGVTVMWDESVDSQSLAVTYFVYLSESAVDGFSLYGITADSELAIDGLNGDKDYYIKIIARNSSMYESEFSVALPVHTMIRDSISSMTAGNDPDWIYVLYWNKKLLQSIDVKNGLPDKSKDMVIPDGYPTRMIYSSNDNSLYISCDFHKIYKYSIDNRELTDISLGDFSNIKLVHISDTDDRLYALADPDLLIFRLSDMTLISQNTIFGTTIRETIYFNGAYQKAYVITYNNDVQVLSLENDTVEKIQEVYVATILGHNVLSPDGSVFSISNTLFNANDLTEVYGSWPISVLRGVFSPDSLFFYAVDGGNSTDGCIHVLDAVSLEETAALSIPYSKYANFIFNSDGSTLVVFSYNIYGDSDHCYYFFRDIRWK